MDKRENSKAICKIVSFYSFSTESINTPGLEENLCRPLVKILHV